MSENAKAAIPRSEVESTLLPWMQFGITPVGSVQAAGSTLINLEKLALLVILVFFGYS